MAVEAPATGPLWDVLFGMSKLMSLLLPILCQGWPLKSKPLPSSWLYAGSLVVQVFTLVDPAALLQLP